MQAYGEVLRSPGLARIIAAQLVARFPQGMYSLAMLLHIEHAHNSYAAAGLVLAGLSIGQAVAGPVTTRLMGRWGTRRVLALTSLISVLVVTAIAVVPFNLGVQTLLAVIAGLSTPPITAAVRTLYPTMVTQKLLTPLFALDATLQEIIWVVGPVAATFVSTQIGTMEGLLVAIAVQVVGAIWFILSPEVGKLRIPKPVKKLGGVLRKPSVRLTVAVGFLLVGGFAASEAAVISVFGHGGAEAGIIIAFNAVGSLIGGLAFGGFTIRRHSLALRLAVSAIGFGLACLFLDFWWLAIMFFIAGIGVAPALSAMSSIVAATVKFQDTPEAYGWIGTGQLVGAALGSAVAGICIDLAGPTGGMIVAASLTVLAMLVAWFTRRRQPDLTEGIGEPPETLPIQLPR